MDCLGHLNMFFLCFLLDTTHNPSLSLPVQHMIYHSSYYHHSIFDVEALTPAEAASATPDERLIKRDRA